MLNEEEQGGDPQLDALCEALRVSGQTTKLLHPIRFLELLIAKEALDDILSQNGETQASKIILHHALSSASLCAEVDELVVRDMTAFSIAAAKAGNMEFYPLANGKIAVSLTFNRVLVPIE